MAPCAFHRIENADSLRTEARWQADVAPASPEVLTIYIGVNDMWRHFDRDDETRAAEFESTLRGLIDTDVVRSSRVIFIEPYLLPVREEQNGWLAAYRPE